MTTPNNTTEVAAHQGFKLSWNRQDIEQRLGFPGARFTKVNTILSLIAASILTILFYAAWIPFSETGIGQMFTARGWTPYLIVLLSAWSLVIIFIKHQKLRLQRRSLLIAIVPNSPDFVLSVTTVGDVDQTIKATVDDYRKFILFNRIQIALSNLRNLGRVSDIDELLRSQADTDESAMETSYSLLKGFVWAIPVLGFIGTVIGLSEAIGGFGQVLSNNTEMSEIASSLKVVTGGLATAFETTLLALVCALGIQMLVTFLRKGEEEFLDDCAEYCQRNVVSKLRIMPFEKDDRRDEPTP